MKSLLKRLVKKLMKSVTVNRSYATKGITVVGEGFLADVINSLVGDGRGVTIIRIDGPLLRYIAFIYTFVACLMFFIALPSLFSMDILEAMQLSHYFTKIFAGILAVLVGTIFSVMAVALIIEKDTNPLGEETGFIGSWFLWVSMMLFIGTALTL